MPILVALFLAPLFLLALRVADVDWPWATSANALEFFNVLRQTTLQAGISGALVLVFGYFGACGLISIRNESWRRIAEVLFILPGLMPPLFLIVAAMNGVELFGPFPIGLGGVVLLHVMMYSGLIGVAWLRAIQAKAGGVVELATIDGASFTMVSRLVVGYLRPEAWAFFWLVFVACFTSFSVPLIVGGHRGETIDVLIYRAALGQGEWARAMGLSVVQIIFLLGLIFVTPIFGRRQGGYTYALTGRKSWSQEFKILSAPFAGILFFIFTSYLLLSSFLGWGKGVSEILSHPVLLQNIFNGLWGSVIQCVLVGVLTFIVTSVVISLLPQPTLQSFFMGYVAPSSAVTGVAFSLYFDATANSVVSTFFVIALAFFLVIYPALYRLRGASITTTYRGQIEQAVVMGLCRFQRFRFILLPQLWRDLCFMSGVAAFWASGDFALARIIAGQDITLALSAQSMLGGYRLEVATVVVWLALLVGVFLFLIFDLLGRTVRFKRHSFVES